MPFLGIPLLLRIVERLETITDDIIVTTDKPDDYANLGFRVSTDLVPGCGALGGLYTSMTMARNPLLAAVACDMPFVNKELFDYQCECLDRSASDVAAPSTRFGLEPLHAVYRCETCLPPIKSALDARNCRVTGWFDAVHVYRLSLQEISKYDPDQVAFWNLNTPGDFEQAEKYALSKEAS